MKQVNGFSLKLKCIDNTGYPSSLTVGKVYQGKIVQRGALAVIDDTGESYVFIKRRFEILDDIPIDQSAK